jgi:hypothetical protein
MSETLIETLQETITSLMAENSQLAQKSIEEKNTIRKLTSDIKELQGKFTCFKADAVTSLKAIDLCILATLPTENQFLTHRARNFRMRHIHQIILNELASFSDRKLITYEDDF